MLVHSSQLHGIVHCMRYVRDVFKLLFLRPFPYFWGRRFQSAHSPVLCFFYLYLFLLHVFSYNITLHTSVSVFLSFVCSPRRFTTTGFTRCCFTNTDSDTHRHRFGHPLLTSAPWQQPCRDLCAVSRNYTKACAALCRNCPLVGKGGR